MRVPDGCTQIECFFLGEPYGPARPHFRCEVQVILEAEIAQAIDHRGDLSDRVPDSAALMDPVEAHPAAIMTRQRSCTAAIANAARDLLRGHGISEVDIERSGLRLRCTRRREFPRTCNLSRY